MNESISTPKKPTTVIAVPVDDRTLEIIKHESKFTFGNAGLAPVVRAMIQFYIAEKGLPLSRSEHEIDDRD